MSPRKELICFSGALIFALAARGQLYVTCLWGPARLTLLGPTGWKQKKFLNSCHSQGTERGNRPRSSVFLGKRHTISFSLWLTPEGQASNWAHTAILSGDPRQQRLALHGPSAALLWARVSQRGASAHVWCPDFCDATQGMPLDTSVARGACLPGFHRTVQSERQFLVGYHPQVTAQTETHPHSFFFY